jgi:hypothetical protein
MHLAQAQPQLRNRKTYHFDISPTVSYCDKNAKIISKYSDLPKIKLTSEEQARLDDQPEPALNETQVLVRELKLASGEVLLQAFQCDYKLLTNYGKFPSNSPVHAQGPFFRVGSIASIITNDEKAVIVERNDALKLWSSFSGFLETEAPEDVDIVTYTGIKEAQEEFLQYADIKVLKAETKAVSLRKSEKTGKLGTIEFIVNLNVDCSSKELDAALKIYLTTALQPNGKPDHTGRFLILDPTNITRENLKITHDDGSVRDILEVEAKNLSFMFVKPILITACKALRIKPPEFLEEQILNENIAEKYTQKAFSDEEKSSFAASLDTKIIAAA